MEEDEVEANFNMLPFLSVFVDLSPGLDDPLAP